MTNEQEKPAPQPYKGLDIIANLMDNQFRIPGTDIRFGLDSLVGFVPGIGDGIGLVVSVYLISIMIRKGAGPIIMVRMVGNIMVDAGVGVVPFLGDIFDFGFKANRRNVDLMKNYYADGTQKPNAFWSVFILLLLLFAVMIALLIGVWKLGAWLWGQVF